MTYTRVIPRDLFNEANLLKCLGQLWITLDRTSLPAYLEGPKPGEPFRIEQDQGDGSIFAANVRLLVRGEFWPLYRPLNSRDPWPLWAETPDGETLEVFSDDGELSPEFLEAIERAGNE